MKQSNIFEMLREQYHLPEKTKLFESFSGIGCQRDAFEKNEIHGGIDYESVGISEIDKHALVSYSAQYCDLENKIHQIEYPSKEEMVKKLQGKMVGYDFQAGKHTITMKNNEKEVRKYYAADLISGNLGDISQIKGKDLPEIDVFVYSFPCTDLSRAGKQGGLNDTRSGLVYEVLRILSEMDHRPKVLIMENVVDLVQSKFIRQFNEIQSELESYGYTNYSETMNAKGYGVAQNRDRIFMVSILGDYYYEFHKPFELKKRLKDYLEEEVDEKYYLSDKLLNYFLENSKKNEDVGNGFRFKTKEFDSVASAVTTKSGSRMDDNFINDSVRLGGLYDDEKGNHQAGSIWNVNGLSPTIDTMQGGHRQPFIVEPTIRIPEATEKGYAEAKDGDGVYLNRPHQKRGVVQNGMIQTLKTSCGQDVGIVIASTQKHAYVGTVDESSPTLTSAMGPGGGQIPMIINDEPLAYDEQNRYIRKDGIVGTLTTDGSSPKHNNRVIHGLRIRKLTPLECWLLMGLPEYKFRLAQKWCSDSALYKQAGNGIVSDVFAYILKNLK